MRHGKGRSKIGPRDDHGIFGDATAASQEKGVKMTSPWSGYAMAARNTVEELCAWLRSKRQN